MGLAGDELAALTALLSALMAPKALKEQDFLEASGLKRDRWRFAVRCLEGRGVLTRHRAAVQGNGKAYQLHREPVPESDRTGEMPTPRARKRNADALKASMTGRPVIDSDPEVIHSSDQNHSSECHEEAATGRPVAQGSMTGRPVECATGRPVGLPIQTFSDSSSLGSSVAADAGPGREEEEGASPEGTQERDERELVARRLLAGVRFKRDRYLLPDARELVIGWLVQRLGDGWGEEYLGRRLSEWSEQAANPSIYLPTQLEALGAPRPQLSVVREQPSEPELASEQRRAEAMAMVRATTKASQVKARRAAGHADGEGGARGSRAPRRAMDELAALADRLARENAEGA